MSRMLRSGGSPPTSRERVLAAVAVLLARGLAKRPPKQIRAVLGWVRRGATPAEYAAASRARGAVTSVSVRCSGRYCLERSIATALVCRAGGYWPRWCAGVRATTPFASHAWVEADGRPVDEPDFIAGYHVLVSVDLPEPGR